MGASPQQESQKKSSGWKVQVTYKLGSSRNCCWVEVDSPSTSAVMSALVDKHYNWKESEIEIISIDNKFQQ